MKVAVIGSCNIDFVTKVNAMPQLNEIIEGTSFAINFGGKGGNQSAAFARLKTETLIITCVGRDIFGQSIIYRLRDAGMDTRYVKTLAGVPTGVATVLVDGTGATNIIIVKGANDCLMPEDIDHAAEDLRKCDLIVVQLELPIETVYRAIDWGFENGVPVLLDPTPITQLDLAHLKRLEFFMPNEAELEFVTKMPVNDLESAKAAARKLVDEGVKNVIVSMGERGSMLVNAECTKLFSPYSVTPIDTTAVGDAFVVSFAHYYLETGDIFFAIDKANHYAALSTTRFGAQKSFFALEEFEAIDSNAN